MRKFFLVFLILLASCSSENIIDNKEETKVNIGERALVEGTDMRIEWMPNLYQNEQFEKEAANNITSDEFLFTLLNIDIQANPEKYEDKISFIFKDIRYDEKNEPTVSFAYVNKTGFCIKSVKLFLIIENKDTKERYVEIGGGLEGDLDIKIPNNTAYYYNVGFPAALEQPIGTKFGQNDVNVYVENLTYDIVE